MKPVVLVSRTVAGDAFRYARYAGRESTHVFELDSVAVGKQLPALPPEQVELLRQDPNKFVESLS